MSARNRILLAFEKAPDATVSGSDLARRLGLTRTAIWKHIRALQAIGFPIRSRGREGYAFEGKPDFSLFPLASRRAAASWGYVHHAFTTASTQIQAKQGAVAGLPEGHVWVAEMQAQGRGRLGRVWASGYGGLWFSLLLRPRLPPAAVAPLSLVAGLTLQRVLASSISRGELTLKWPNDLMARLPQGRRKLAGILTEMSGEMDRAAWVVLGMGLNVYNTLPKELSFTATSLQALSQTTENRATILCRFLSAFSHAYTLFQQRGFEAFRENYESHQAYRGETITLRTSQGPQSGRCRGVDAQGALLIESRRKIHTILEGEILPHS